MENIGIFEHSIKAKSNTVTKVPADNSRPTCNIRLLRLSFEEKLSGHTSICINTTTVLSEKNFSVEWSF